MDATCAIQNSIHVFSLVHINMCPGFWVHIKKQGTPFSRFPPETDTTGIYKPRSTALL